MQNVCDIANAKYNWQAASWRKQKVIAVKQTHTLALSLIPPSLSLSRWTYRTEGVCVKEREKERKRCEESDVDSVTRKKSPNVYQSCLKIISLEK